MVDTTLQLCPKGIRSGQSSPIRVISALTVIFSSGFITPGTIFLLIYNPMQFRSLTHNKPMRSALVLFVLDCFFYGTLNTNKVAQVMLVAGYVLLMANLYVLVYGVTSLIRLYGIELKKRKRLSLYMSLFLGLIIAIQSIGELSAHDVFVMGLLAAFGYGYITYVSMSKQKQTNL